MSPAFWAPLTTLLDQRPPHTGPPSTLCPPTTAWRPGQRTKGAKIISNSWGGREYDGIISDQEVCAWDWKCGAAAGVIYTASTGDNGYHSAGSDGYPGTSQYVVGVGGTSLHLDVNNNRANETAWRGAGSGCSQYIPKPTYQTDSGGWTWQR